MSYLNFLFRQTVMLRNNLFILCILLSFSLHAQTAKECYKAMPDSLAPLLTEVNRADFIDFLESNMRAQVTNRLGGKSEMTRLTDDFISIQTSKQSIWQMKVLPLNDTTRIVCTVATVSAPARDSHIRFYTTDWKPLPTTPYFSGRPTIDQFLLPKPDSISTFAFEEARRQANLPLFMAELSPDAATLTFTFDALRYLEREAAETLRPAIRPTLIYQWKEGRFQLVE